MAKRRIKKRTHAKVSEEELAKIPRSMVLHLGQSLHNHLLTQLVRDFRMMMQPHTAIKLRERKLNKLKDFVVMAGPLGVTDLFIFNQSEDTGNVSLRFAKLPRGPTLQFKINTYSLVKDVSRMLKRPKSVGTDSAEFHTPPLLVLNGFGLNVAEMEHQEKLTVTMFQNMFPPIQPQSTNVSLIKRVLMINKNADGSIDVRHYAIDTKLVEESRNVKKLINSKNLLKKIPNLNKSMDVSDLILDPYAVGGITSDSEVEDDAVVEINQLQEQELKRRVAEPLAPSTKKRAIKLTELGPRINMTLVKVEEGVGEGKTLFHATITKLELEQQALDKKHEKRRQLREQRKAEQKKNVEEKLRKKQEKKERREWKKQQREAGEGGNDGEGLQLELELEDEVDIKPEDYENDSDLLFSE